MNDNSFNDLLDQTFNAKEKYLALLEKAEAELIERYGRSAPSKDDWITSYHKKGGCPETVLQLENIFDYSNRDR